MTPEQIFPPTILPTMEKLSSTTEEFIIKQILDVKIKIQDIPFEIRTNHGIYLAGFRVTRHLEDTFIEISKLIMSDILVVSDIMNDLKGLEKLAACKLCENVINLLQSHITLVSFESDVYEKFLQQDYIPFLYEARRRAEKQDFYISRWCGYA